MSRLVHPDRVPVQQITETFRSETLRRAVASLPCAHCGIEGRSQAAHSNQYMHGKGGAKKASDAAIFPLCATSPSRVGCHEMFDQNNLVPADLVEQKTESFIASTLIKLVEQGFLKVMK